MAIKRDASSYIFLKYRVLLILVHRRYSTGTDKFTRRLSTITGCTWSHVGFYARSSMYTRAGAYVMPTRENYVGDVLVLRETHGLHMCISVRVADFSLLRKKMPQRQACCQHRAIWRIPSSLRHEGRKILSSVLLLPSFTLSFLKWHWIKYSVLSRVISCMIYSNTGKIHVALIFISCLLCVCGNLCPAERYVVKKKEKLRNAESV